MKKILLLPLAFLIICKIQAQISKIKQVVIVPCKSGTLIIDGVAFGTITADDANRQTLTFGEHYLQLKTGNDKINLTVTIDENTKNILKLGCESPSEITGIRLINKQLSLSGLLSDDMEDNIIGLDKDDNLIINAAVINKKGSATIFITEVNKGNEIYRKQDFKVLENEKISITSKGIYKISIYTEALFGKDAILTIDRVPSKTSNPKFNTTPKRIYDTSYVEVLKTTAMVYSVGNLEHQNKTAISINLPANTSYWTYWIGVDQEAQDKLKNFMKDLSPVISVFSSNPLVLYGMKLIPSLPIMNTTASINYKFMNTQNGRYFVNGLAYSYYKFKHADNISTDYSLIKGTLPDLVLAMQNESSLIGHNVEIRVVAFIIKSRLILEESE
ncbi:MAG: hypothetical protein IPN43_07820 [Chitinophagaceae bacterium]|nr:hypothetical protein [Chitinophagaceae bacterium]